MSSAGTVSAAQKEPATKLYVQRQDDGGRWSDDIERYFDALPQSIRSTSAKARIARMLDEIEDLSPTMRALSDAALAQEAAALRKLLRREGLARTAVVRSFALIREVASRTI